MTRPAASTVSGQRSPATSSNVIRFASTELPLEERETQTGGARPSPHLAMESLIAHEMSPADSDGFVSRYSKAPSKPKLAKKRSNLGFFEEAFLGDQSSWARERVHGDAIVMAELKTNVIISDEYTFITGLSYHLSARYQRPISSIVITLQHGACMFFAGSFEAAYVMSIFALPSQLLPTTNKRNAALIQDYMLEALGVRPARGFLRFVPTQEEHLACNGKTAAGEIEELEKGSRHESRQDRRASSPVSHQGHDKTGSGSRVIFKGMSNKRMPSVKVFNILRPLPGIGIPTPDLTPPGSAGEGLSTMPVRPSFGLGTEGDPMQDEDMETSLPQHQNQTRQRKKSFVASIFSRSGNK